MIYWILFPSDTATSNIWVDGNTTDLFLCMHSQHAVKLLAALQWWKLYRHSICLQECSAQPIGNRRIAWRQSISYRKLLARVKRYCHTTQTNTHVKECYKRHYKRWVSKSSLLQMRRLGISEVKEEWRSVETQLSRKYWTPWW